MDNRIKNNNKKPNYEEIHDDSNENWEIKNNSSGRHTFVPVFINKNTKTNSKVDNISDGNLMTSYVTTLCVEQ